MRAVFSYYINYMSVCVCVYYSLLISVCPSLVQLSLWVGRARPALATDEQHFSFLLHFEGCRYFFVTTGGGVGDEVLVGREGFVVTIVNTTEAAASAEYET